jgi:hypothetical protein
VLVAAAIVAGSVRGMFTLVQATAISDRWGPDGYASLNGVFTAPQTAAIALAPAGGAVLAADLGGYPPLFAVLAACGLASAVLAAATRPHRPRDSRALLPASLPESHDDE